MTPAPRTGPGPGDAPPAETGRGGARPTGTVAGAPAPPRPETPRIRLARVVSAAATGCPGVVDLDAGDRDRYCTVTGTERLPGVLVMADGAPGTYAATLYVRAALVDLPDLGRRLRSTVRDAAADHDLADHLGDVEVVVTDIDDRRAFA